MFKNTDFGKTGRDKVQKGFNIVADAVKATLGYGGRNVLIGSGYGPVYPTKDGATVAKSITLVEPIENMGATMAKEIAFKTLADAGDGTTTSTLLGQAIIEAGVKAIEEGANPVELKKGIDRAVVAVVNRLKELSKEIPDHDTLIQIATISANNDPEIGKLIADAFEKVGKEGKIDVSDSKTHETYVDIVNGMKIDRGFTSPIFINSNKRRVCELENPMILVSDRKVSTMKELLPFFEKALNDKSQRPILLIVDRLEGEAASLIYKNRSEGKLNVCVILAPSFGDDRTRSLEDIAILTGATFISDMQGMTIEKAGVKDCGSCERVIVEEHSTLFINAGGNSLDIEERAQMLRAEIEEGSSQAKDRLSKLLGKIANIRVGAITQTEAIEKKDRIDDALCATRAATEEGYLAGGGTALLHCVNILNYGEGSKPGKGEQIILDAIQEPFAQIMRNAGVDEDNIIALSEEIMEADYGMGRNVKSDKFENLLDAGVIDPTKVVRCALENASSIAGIFLTTECVVSDPKPKEY